jgi:hypothetical protein
MTGKGKSGYKALSSLRDFSLGPAGDLRLPGEEKLK